MNNINLFGNTSAANRRQHKHITLLFSALFIPLFALGFFASGCGELDLTSSFTVKFDSKGGSPVPDQIITLGGKITPPKDPTRQGYTFDGWYIDLTSNNKFKIESEVITANITLYAKWIPNGVTVTFVEVTLNANGGSYGSVTNGTTITEIIIKDISVASGGTVPIGTDLPKRGGYIPSGWNTKADGTGDPFVFGTTKVTANITIYAQWGHIITLYAINGTAESTTNLTWTGFRSCPDLTNTNCKSGVTATLTVESGKTASAPASLPIRTSYALSSWNTQEDGTGTAFVFGTTPVTANITIYAQWGFTITLDANGGTAGSATSIIVENGKTATIPNSGLPTKAGYTLTSWNTKADGTGTAFEFGTTPVTANITIFAQWTIISPNQFIVLFNSNSGSFVPYTTVNFGEKVTKPADPTRANYVFGGWFKDANYAFDFNFVNETITANITLYAKWIINTYTVTFNTGVTELTIDPVTVNHGEKATKPADPTRANYVFGGWFKDANYAFDFTTEIITSNITLFAKWTTNTYTVTFNSNSGSFVPFATVIQGEKVTKPADPIRPNYAFRGWYKDNNTFAKAFDFATEIITANVTLHAKWAAIYTVTFNSNYGSFVPFATVIQSETVTKPADPTRENYVFGGWYKEALLTNAFIFANEIITGSIMLYAKWKFPFVKISAGINHSLALKSNGELWAWGSNFSGQLGDGTTTNRNSPVKIGEGYSQISAGAYHNLALKSNGELWAWGWNVYGQLGDGTTTSRNSPIKIGEGYSQISAGAYHSLALKSNGELWTWGFNGQGQLGDGTIIEKHSPTKIGDGYSQISAGSDHSLALKSNGELWAWGFNYDGQLGDGTTTSRNSPVKIGDGYSQIAAGHNHSLAFKINGVHSGEIWAWGDNGHGQVGDGTTDRRNSPVEVGSWMQQIFAGGYHSFSLKSSGELWAWGMNYYGQLGDGTTTDRTSPKIVGDGYSQISAGLYHTFALKSNGELWAWGKNDYGQLGDGTTTQRNSPVKIDY
ncbi:hypothetical protein CHS0354_000425 [Potamilus streckersoni]|uniref:RCC1-like domain-containing protein n=1 Tax=Potamilus streckersoni TaxID=2493646 RepID=A0AAE0T6K9_9BIVA|nr:hypothetical protein CHS0354_000425 [Potamilus streckersoni]